MAKMWQERADYGHFFYRIPNGESAADAYDRVSGFNESLWRGFGEEGFASVAVLVTHGLMTRVFLMKWYHFSVEYFEDLRNVEHCEFVVMRLDPGSGKYILQNRLRTWSALRREREEQRLKEERQDAGPVSPQSPIPVRKKWAGCQEVGDFDGMRGDDFARRQAMRRQNTLDLFRDNDDVLPPASLCPDNEPSDASPETASHPHDKTMPTHKRPPSPSRLQYLRAIGRDGGGSRSGAASPNIYSEDEDAETKERRGTGGSKPRGAMALALAGGLDTTAGVGRVRADALGDQSDVEDEGEDGVDGKREVDGMDEVEGMRRREGMVDGSVR